MLSSMALGSSLVARRAGHDELALRLVPAADVLKDEDVALVGQVLRDSPGRSLRPAIDAVGRAQQDERQRALDFLGDVDGGVELDAVAHGDHRLGGGVALADVGRLLGGRHRAKGKVNHVSRPSNTATKALDFMVVSKAILF